MIPLMLPYAASRFRTDLASEAAQSPDAMDNNNNVGYSVWRPDGGRLFAVEGSASETGAVYSYSVTSAGVVFPSGSTITLNSNTSRQSLAFNGDGTKLYCTSNLIEAETYSLSTAYGGTATLDGTTGGLGNIASLFFNADGTEMFYWKTGGLGLHKRTLSTAYNLNTAGSESSLGITGLYFDVSRGGTLLLASQGDTVTEYQGDTPYDFANFTTTGETLTISGAGVVQGFYKPNGESLNIRVGPNIYTYDTVL